MVTSVTPSETHDEAVHRLSAQALKRDLRIYEHTPSGEFYCSSFSQPDVIHRVTLVSCECDGFARHQRCQHHARLLHHLGELPRLGSDHDPDPPAVPVVVCGQCGEPMRYLAGVSFDCGCGHTWSADWQAADDVDRRIAERSRTDSDLLDWIERMLTPGGDAVPAGVDPDQCPGREDVAAALELWSYSANEIAAVLLWQRDRQDTADRMAA